MDLRLVLPLVLLVGGAIVAFAGAAPQAALGPAEALTSSASEVAVKGMVTRIDEGNRTFVLTDGEAELFVAYDKVLPAALADGASLVAKGTLVRGEGPVHLAANEIVLGCPSKYE